LILLMASSLALAFDDEVEFAFNATWLNAPTVGIHAQVLAMRRTLLRDFI